MKKVILLLVGIFLVGMCYSYSLEVNGEENTETSMLNVKENDGEFIDSEDSGKPTRASRTVAGSRTVKIQKIFFEITDLPKEATPVSMPKTNFSVSYTLNNKEVLLHEGKTNAAGEISNLSFPNIPNEVTTLNIRFYLGNDERGFVQRYNKKPYTFHHARTIPENSIIDVSSSSARFGVTGDTDSYFYNYVAAKINYIFEQSVQEYSNNVAKANDLFPDTKPFELAPINMNFEKGQMLDENNGFNKNGHLGGGIPDIVIVDKSDRTKFTDPIILKRTVMHEWTHWNWFRYAYAPSGVYDGQYGYNTNPRVSYKEGWALINDEMFARNYDLDWIDSLVQTDKYNGVNRLFGKSTNMTVLLVLYDLIDVISKDEDYSIARRYLDEELSELEQKKLNLGIMHTIMAESKATTLQEFLTYLEKNYVRTKKDKADFAKVLEVNGLSREGAFTLDNNGKPLTKPLQASAVFSSEETVDAVDLEE